VTLYVIAATVVSSLVSLIGGILLLARERRIRSLLPALTAFAAGVLLATAFLDLLPEAAASLDGASFILALAGFLAFYVLERVIRSVHGHARSSLAEQPSTALVLIGDTIHNMVDGAVIAGAFMVNVSTGIATSVAVAVHEIPQEIGDFAVLLHNGMRPRNVLLLNLWSALAAVAGALAALAFGQNANVGPSLIAVTAVFFIYIAGSDLIPEIQQADSATNPSWLLGGVAAVWLLLSSA
jgi:zinc and cadmium transporter